MRSRFAKDKMRKLRLLGDESPLSEEKMELTVKIHICWVLVTSHTHTFHTPVLTVRSNLLRTDKILRFMYRRPILFTLYGAVDFLNVLKKYIMYL
jgi:hypothetical protein